MAKRNTDKDQAKEAAADEAALRSKARSKTTAETAVRMEDLLSTGSTMLNLALTGKTKGGFAKGKYQWFVGDSSSGKTFFVMTVLAEANQNPNFANYDFYRDDNEDGALMDVAAFFGQGTKDRLKDPPHGVSKTSQLFYRNLRSCLERAKAKKRPFIYVLDSENGLDSDEAKKKRAEQTKGAEKAEESGGDNKAKGSYGDGKAKYHSQNMREIIPELKETGCILIIVSQTRDNIGFGFDPKTVSGGKALKFFATAEVWTSVKQKLKKRVMGKDRDVGILVECRIKKNRFTGRTRTIHIPIYYSSGFDDVGSCVDWMIEEDGWKKSKKTGLYSCPELDFEGEDEESIINHIQDNNLEKDMRMAVKAHWHKIEEELNKAVQRKIRYA